LFGVDVLSEKNMGRITRNKEQVFIGAQVPQKMKEEICRVVNLGNYLNESDFIRTAVRELLNKENNSIDLP